MDSDQRGHAKLSVSFRTAFTHHAYVASRHGSSRRGSETYDQTRLDCIQFRLQPRSAGGHFARVRFLVEPPLSARLPLEVFHRVREVERDSIDTSGDERTIEQLSRRPDERFTRAVFLIAGLLAHEHDARPRWARTENGAGRVAPQGTRPTRFRRLSQSSEVAAVRYRSRLELIRQGPLAFTHVVIDRNRQQMCLAVRETPEQGSSTLMLIGSAHLPAWSISAWLASGIVFRWT
jgi:hypothetical protein